MKDRKNFRLPLLHKHSHISHSQIRTLFQCFIFCHQFFIRFSGFRRKQFGGYAQLGNDIDKRIDPSLHGKEFIQHHYFFLLQYAIPALKGAAFIADNVLCFIEQLFYFIECGLSVLHGENCESLVVNREYSNANLIH